MHVVRLTALSAAIILTLAACSAAPTPIPTTPPLDTSTYCERLTSILERMVANEAELDITTRRAFSGPTTKTVADMRTELRSGYDTFLHLAEQLRALTPPSGAHDIRRLTIEYASIAEQIHDAMSRMINNPKNAGVFNDAYGDFKRFSRTSVTVALQLNDAALDLCL